MAPKRYRSASAATKRAIFKKKVAAFKGYSAGRTASGQRTARRYTNSLGEEVKTIAPLLTPVGTLDPPGFASLNVLPFTSNPANAMVINAMSAGSGGWQRVGRKIHMKSLRIRGMVQDANAVDNPAVPLITFAYSPMLLRMVLVYDRSPQGLPPDYNVIFRNQKSTDSGAYNAPLDLAAVSLTNACAISQAVDPASMGRFTVLWDKLMRSPVLGEVAYTSTPTVANSAQLLIDETIPLNLESTYLDNNGTFASVITGSLLLFAVCSQKVEDEEGYQPWVFTGSVNLKYLG